MFRCVGTSTDEPCPTPTGKVKSFRTVETCIEHYKVVHKKRMTAQQVQQVCKIPVTQNALQEFDGGHNSVPMDIASVGVPMDIASVAVPTNHHHHLPSASASSVNHINMAEAEIINLDEISSLGSLGLSALGINNSERVAMLELLRTLRNNDTEQMMIPSRGASSRGASSSSHVASSSRGGSSRR